MTDGQKIDEQMFRERFVDPMPSGNMVPRPVRSDDEIELMIDALKTSPRHVRALHLIAAGEDYRSGGLAGFILHELWMIGLTENDETTPPPYKTHLTPLGKKVLVNTLEEKQKEATICLGRWTAPHKPRKPKK
jgi:hypothetical protein